MRRFRTRWLSLRDAHAFVAKHHRHHLPAVGGIVALGLWEDERLVGVGVLGRPVSRQLQHQGAVEVTRLCVIAPHAASALLGRLRRVAQSLGFVKVVTYIESHESGISLGAAGWEQLDIQPAREWSRIKRPRTASRVIPRTRWWVDLRQQQELEV